MLNFLSLNILYSTIAQAGFKEQLCVLLTTVYDYELMYIKILQKLVVSENMMALYLASNIT